MNGGGRNVGSPASLSNNSYAGATRRGLNGMPGGQAHLVSPTYFPSPHSLHAAQMDNRVDVFPSRPYTPASNLFISPELANTLTSAPKARIRRQVTNVGSSKFSYYGTIYNVEDKVNNSAVYPQLRSQTYQTSSKFTGKDIFLRRLINVKLGQETCDNVLNSLKEYRHPNLVGLHEITSTDEFVMGSNDVLMAYKYVAGAKSLQEAFFTGGRVTEGLLWSFTCQLVSLLRSFHETMVPLRGLHVSKIIYVESTGRFYFTALGLADLVDPKPLTMNPLPSLMKNDIQALGLILFQLATQQINATAEQFNNRQLPGFSLSFCELIKTCLESNADSAQLCHALGERMSMEVGHQEGHADYLMAQCSEEMHNGRLMKLLIKLNFALQAEGQLFGDIQQQRFTLQVFSQFLFNQVDDQNATHIDWGHVYHCLNKLDCGSEEVIQLIEPTDNSSIIVVSYADLRHILDTVFEQLKQSTPSALTEVENPHYQ